MAVTKIQVQCGSEREVGLFRSAAYFGLLVLTITICLFIRKSDAFLTPQFWAEDGPAFFREAYLHGIDSILKRQAGYLLIFQRTVAYIVSFFPIVLAPKLYNLSALFVVFFVLLYLYSPRVKLPAKHLFALAIVLAPVRNEVFLNLTNTHWLFSLILILLIISDLPETKFEKLFDFTLLLFLGLNGPFIVLFAPLILVRFLFVEWNLWLGFMTFTTFLLAGWQWSGIEVSRQEIDGVASLQEFGVVIAYYAKQMFWGAAPFIEGQNSRIIFFFVAALLINAIVLTVSLRRREFAPLAFCLAGLAVLFSTLYAFKVVPVALLGGGERYFFVPIVMLIWSLLFLYRKVHFSFGLPVFAVLVNVIVHVDDYRAKPEKNYFWEESSKCIGVEEVCVVPHPPDNWSVIIPKRHE